MNLPAGPGVAGREFRPVPGHGVADYLLFVGAKAAGVIEAKPEGHTLSGVEIVDEIRSALGQARSRISWATSSSG
jgi:hypothetical protein